MTDTDRRPSGKHQGGEMDGESSAENTAPGRLDPDMLRVAHQAVSRLLRAARRLHGHLPRVGDPEWMTGG